ncbi:MAG: hypothetical protein HY606_07220 [Planctomycetes bacterium]|nr:hypothetical protein [Planctomycetota bacterium]
MNCGKILSYFSDAYDDAIDTEPKKEFFRHLEECLNCKKEYDEYSKVLAKIPTVQIISAPQIEQSVLTAVKEMDIKNTLADIIPETTPKLAAVFNIKQIAFSAIAFVGIFFAGFYLNKLLTDIKTPNQDDLIRSLQKQIESSRTSEIKPDSHDITNISFSQNNLCCSLPLHNNNLKFVSLELEDPQDEFKNELYVLTQPFKLNENFKVYLLAGEQLNDTLCDQNSVLNNIIYAQHNAPEKIPPLCLSKLRYKHFKSEISDFLDANLKDYSPVPTSGLAQYFEGIVKKPRGVIIVINNFIHSFIICRDKICLQNSIGYLINSSLQDYFLSKNYLEFNWKYSFNIQNIKLAISESKTKANEIGTKSIVGIHYQISPNADIIADYLPFDQKTVSKIADFTPSSEDEFDSLIYTGYLKKHFSKLNLKERSSVKKTLSTLLSLNNDAVRESVISLYLTTVDKKEFKLEEFFNWVDSDK